MVQMNTYQPATAQALFKNVYADKIVDAKPKEAWLMNNIKFNQAEKQGGKYLQSVKLSGCQGVTYAAPYVVPNLNSPIPTTTRFAELEAYHFYLREQVSYDLIARSTAGSGNAQKAAFINGLGQFVEWMNESINMRAEAELLHGQSSTGWGVVSSVAGNVITITTATFADGLFVGMENMMLDVHDNTGNYVKTVKLTGADPENRAISVDNSAGILATHILRPQGNYGNSMLGITKMLGTSGTVFAIDNSVYSMWKGSSYNAAGSLTFPKLLKAVRSGFVKGVSGDLDVLVHPRTFDDLVVDFDTNRTDYADQVAKGKVIRGVEGEGLLYKYHNGVMKIRAHMLMKESEGLILTTKDFKRIGATDITFGLPGMPENFLFQLENTPACEMRCMFDFQVFTPRPSVNVLLTGIVNSV